MIEVHWYIRFLCYLGYLIITVKGFLRTAIRWAFGRLDQGWHTTLWKTIYTEHVYRRIEDCWNRPVSSAPGEYIDVVPRERKSTLNLLEFPKHAVPVGAEPLHCINLASYNYLGFGGYNKNITPQCLKAVAEHGLNTGFARADRFGGSLGVHVELEAAVAKFLGKQSAIVGGMGFGTNAYLIPGMVLATSVNPSEVLIFSDELNHRSIVEGCRLSGASVKGFKHNNISHLESLMEASVSSGKFKRIFVVVEGLYSMEGSFVDLRRLVALKAKYDFHIWLDEAHSIGAVGRTGRGVCELLGVSTDLIDVMMGTFTKSFGSAGGYVAADAATIEAVRRLSVGFNHASSMSPLTATQTLEALKVIDSPQGVELCRRLRANSDLFYSECIRRGLHIICDEGSPIICAMLIVPERISAFSRECLKRGLAVVVVGYPATPATLSRARFCLSAAHSTETIKKALDAIEEAAEVVGIKYGMPANGVSPSERLAYLLKADLPSKDTLRIKAIAEPEPEVDRPAKKLEGEEKFSSLSKGLLSKTNASMTSLPSSSISSEGNFPMDPLLLGSRPTKELVSLMDKTMRHYGVGTCGPRGFYGTTLEHEKLEKTISQYFGTKNSIVYSHSSSLIVSSLSCLVNDKDTVYLQANPDSQVISALRLSKPKAVLVWRNMDELVSQLTEQQAKSLNASATNQKGRQWLIVRSGKREFEALGGLDGVKRLRLAFNVEVFLDDSLKAFTEPEAVSTIGSLTVRGTAAVEFMQYITCYACSLETVVGSSGGFCTSVDQGVAEHQVLYGGGYCFSASAPAAACAAATAVISSLMKTNEDMSETNENKSSKPVVSSLDESIASLSLNISRVRQVLDQAAVEKLASSDCFNQVIKFSSEAQAEEFREAMRCNSEHMCEVDKRLYKGFSSAPHDLSDGQKTAVINVNSAMTEKDILSIESTLRSVLAH